MSTEVSVVVSDTSPVRALHHLSLLHLLPEQFDRVIIPPAVLEELENPRPRFEAIARDVIEFAEVLPPAEQHVVSQLRAELGPREAEAIALALELGSALLIDEAQGRAEARRRGLRSVGVLGVLLEGKRRGSIAVVAPLISALQQGLGFYVSGAIRAEVLRLADEEPG